MSGTRTPLLHLNTLLSTNTHTHTHTHTETHVEWRGGLNGPSSLARDCGLVHTLTMGALLVPENMTQFDPCRGQDGLLLSSLPCVGDEYYITVLFITYIPT